MYKAVFFTDNTHPLQISIGLGPYKVASVLRKNGYKTLVLNHLSWFSLEELKDVIDQSVSDETLVIGFSTTFMQTVETNAEGKRTYGPMIGTDLFFPQGKDFENEIISYVKAINPNVKVIVGGVKTDYSTKNKNIDYAFLGYSETSIMDLMSHLTTGSEIPHSTVNEHGITIIDDRTAPRYKFTEDMMIWEKTDIVNHKVLPIEIGRGCIFQCKFCSFPLNGKKSVDYNKNVDVVYDELMDAYTRFGITHFMIVDDTFNDHINKLKNLESVIQRLPFKPMFWCYARLDLLCTNPGMIDVMYNIGVRGMLFGIETLDQNTGRIIGKGYDRQKQINMIRYIRETYPDMSMNGNFIAGLPHESLDSIKLTMQQLSDGEIPLNSYMIKELWIMEESFSAFNSDLNLNYYKYGYEITENISGILIWKNEYTDMKSISVLAEQCLDAGREKDHFYVPAHDSFELVNLGYDFYEASQTLFKHFNWDKAQATLPVFIDEYKEKFFQLLQFRGN